MKEERIRNKREELLKLFEKATDKRIFSKIENVVEWQKKHRDEWKKSSIS